jgi:hypothetical protein
VLAVQLAELVALHVFRQADEDSRFISMEYTTERIDELKAHPPGCRCGRNCSAASVVRPESVWRIASRWQRETNTTRLRALR